MSSIYGCAGEHPDIPFERYADDAICHCRSEAQALELRQALERRFADCKLQLHPQKTKVVYWKDANRPGKYPDNRCGLLQGTWFTPTTARHCLTALLSPLMRRTAEIFNIDWLRMERVGHIKMLGIRL
jgi:hypothetical protein